MLQKVPTPVVVLCLLCSIGGLPSPSCIAQETVSNPPPGREETATITGTVIYQNDPARPWRLGRYYIRNAKTGHLAEAVVALSGKGLRATDATRVAQTVNVDQKDFQFTPETIAIRAGDRVRFLNNDAQVHNVQSVSSRHSFNVNMLSGSEHTETFPQAGGVRQPYRIGCTYHTAMRSWVYVFDHPWYQLTDATGTYRMKDVPPGEYRLEVAHPAGEMRMSRMIQVRAGETLQMDLTIGPDQRVSP